MLFLLYLRALNYLFDTLKKYGGSFSHDFWGVVAKGALFPIFDDLRLSGQDRTSITSKEDMSVWLSTTLIQALRQLIVLFTFYFDDINFLLEEILDILIICITQESETLSKLGSMSLQELVESNYSKLNTSHWNMIINVMVDLLAQTTPSDLFFELDEDEITTSFELPPGMQPAKRFPRPQPADFQKIIVKCILHHSVLQTLDDIFRSSDGAILNSLNHDHLLTVVDAIFKSFQFAQEFNRHMDLRTTLLKMGFMKQLPNLVKQETNSISLYIHILGQMAKKANAESDQQNIESRLIP
jgi:brefeldin A-inhibited guanine nucleotide-exchange protein